MPTVRLTDAAVQRLKAPPGQRVDYFDGAFPGLALRVTGAVDQRPERRAWTLFYRLGGKQRRLTFEGGYPALDLKKARQKATEAQLLIRAGQDPAAVQAAVKAAVNRAPDTVASVCGSLRRTPRATSEVAGLYPRYATEPGQPRLAAVGRTRHQEHQPARRGGIAGRDRRRWQHNQEGWQAAPLGGRPSPGQSDTGSDPWDAELCSR